MLIPAYWAEGRLQRQLNGKSVTVRRWGWSDVSQAAAQTHADQRTAEAMGRFERGETTHRRDLKRAYNGSEGVPIREEIVDRHGDVIITRNAYGALCLNTPNVLFADIDYSDGMGCATYLAITIMAWITALVAAVVFDRVTGILLAILGPFIGYLLWSWFLRLRMWFSGGREQIARQRILGFLTNNAHWNVRLYRTPAGLRVLATHQLFDPQDPEVLEFFKAIDADPIYVRMCLRQNCFRARVSPKPWRIQISEHIKPRTVWPIAPERLPERRRWIEDYEEEAKEYASCQFIEALGSGAKDSKTELVQRLHDDLCQASRNLPLA